MLLFPKRSKTLNPFIRYTVICTSTLSFWSNIAPFSSYKIFGRLNYFTGLVKLEFFKIFWKYSKISQDPPKSGGISSIQTFILTVAFLFVSISIPKRGLTKSCSLLFNLSCCFIILLWNVSTFNSILVIEDICSIFWFCNIPSPSFSFSRLIVLERWDYKIYLFILIYVRNSTSIGEMGESWFKSGVLWVTGFIQ